MSPVTGLARLPGQILWCVHMANFSPVYQDEIQETQSKWWNINLYRSRLTSFVDSFNFFNHGNSHIPKAKINTRQKLYQFGHYVANAKLFCPKSFIPVTRAGVFIWENFHPGYRDLGRKNRDLGNRASPASHMNTSKILRRKEW